MKINSCENKLLNFQKSTPFIYFACWISMKLVTKSVIYCFCLVTFKNGTWNLQKIIPRSNFWNPNIFAKKFIPAKLKKSKIRKIKLKNIMPYGIAVSLDVGIDNVFVFQATWMPMHPNFNNPTLHKVSGQGGHPHHVACFGSVVIHRSPVPKNIRAIVTNTEILRPATR